MGMDRRSTLGHSVAIQVFFYNGFSKVGKAHSLVALTCLLAALGSPYAQLAIQGLFKGEGGCDVDEVDVDDVDKVVVADVDDACDVDEVDVYHLAD